MLLANKNDAFPGPRAAKGTNKGQIVIPEEIETLNLNANDENAISLYITRLFPTTYSSCVDPHIL